jgi:pSer/pThr/pTyr-binding forkhead associated (FHA) protein
MQVKLHLVKGNPQGKQVEVPPGALTVGRAEDSGLIIASTRVSRHHCEIVNEQNRLIIRDKSSGNGTFINGVKLSGEQALGAGDEVSIGPLTFQVEINGSRQAGGKLAAKLATVKPAAAKPVAAKPVAAQPVAAKPVLGAKPAGKPTLAAPAAPKKVVGKPSPADILSSLEQMAGGKKKSGGAAKGGDVLQISDDDLLDAK